MNTPQFSGTCPVCGTSLRQWEHFNLVTHPDGRKQRFVSSGPLHDAPFMRRCENGLCPGTVDMQVRSYEEALQSATNNQTPQP